MKDKNALTEAQKEIYDSVTAKGWFTSDSLGYRFSNRDSQCRKIAKKGYFKHKADFDPDYPGDLTRLISRFKKLKPGFEGGN
jgi:hypothetical protein